MEIGQKLKQARKEAGMTQEAAAELLSVSRQSISNWECGRSYPDIVSVIRMSELYSVSLDTLLKEEKQMNQNYQDFLKESTNTVNAGRRLGEIILLSTYFVVWLATVLALCLTRGRAILWVGIALRCVLLPLLLFITTLLIAKNNYWGKGNWVCVAPAALSFLTVPYTSYTEMAGMASFVFRFPNFPYMIVGALLSVCGIGIGTLLAKKKKGEP